MAIWALFAMLGTLHVKASVWPILSQSNHQVDPVLLVLKQGAVRFHRYLHSVAMTETRPKSKGSQCLRVAPATSIPLRRCIFCST
ncbi:hypothetical protein F5B18DRAFT_488024 [Nemania serpens]|nr:hypothetical protein F5B18DRAFT_488024 [Nemania serpens]